MFAIEKLFGVLHSLMNRETCAFQSYLAAGSALWSVELADALQESG